MQYTHIYLGLIEFQAQIMLQIWDIFKGDSPSRSRLGSQKYLHIVDKNTSTMLTKIPPQFGQKYLHNGDKNTSTIKEEPKKMMETSFTKVVSFYMNIIELMSNGQDQIVLILIFINPTT